VKMTYHRIEKYSDCTVYYDERGFHHREDGPAVEWVDGRRRWCIHGKLHREDGPALVWFSGAIEWYLEGKQYTQEEHARMIKLKVFW